MCNKRNKEEIEKEKKKLAKISKKGEVELCALCARAVPRVACVVERQRPVQCTKSTPITIILQFRAELDGKAINQITLSNFMLFFRRLLFT